MVLLHMGCMGPAEFSPVLVPSVAAIWMIAMPYMRAEPEDGRSDDALFLLILELETPTATTDDHALPASNTPTESRTEGVLAMFLRIRRIGRTGRNARAPEAGDAQAPDRLFGPLGPVGDVVVWLLGSAQFVLILAQKRSGGSLYQGAMLRAGAAP